MVGIGKDLRITSKCNDDNILTQAIFWYSIWRSPAKTYWFATPTLKQSCYVFSLFSQLLSENIKNLQQYICLCKTFFGIQFEEDWLRNKKSFCIFKVKNVEYVFRFLTHPWPKIKYDFVATRALAIHKFWAIFEEDRLKFEPYLKNIGLRTNKL